METLTNACIVLTAGRGLAEGAEGRRLRCRIIL